MSLKIVACSKFTSVRQMPHNFIDNLRVGGLAGLQAAPTPLSA